MIVQTKWILDIAIDSTGKDVIKMKIEKVSENQIRCTLTKQDLAERQINLKELAYGSEKAKGLFHDMIQQANYEFGFDVSDNPLMVEAIPLPSESLVLLITKVEYPEELDTRFSQFTEADEDDLFPNGGSDDPSEYKGADDILELFNKIRGEMQAEKEEKNSADKQEEPVAAVPANLTKMFEFSSLEQIERLAHVLAGFYSGRNDLYKNEKTNRFYLVVHKDDHTPEEFNKVCNVICEYALQKNYNDAIGAYFAEHEKAIIKGNALQILAQL